MSKWKTWQLVFLGYLLLLNLIVVCALASFLINSNFLTQLNSELVVNRAAALPSPTLMATPIPLEPNETLQSQASALQPAENNPGPLAGDKSEAVDYG